MLSLYQLRSLFRHPFFHVIIYHTFVESVLSLSMTKRDESLKVRRFLDEKVKRENVPGLENGKEKGKKKRKKTRWKGGKRRKRGTRTRHERDVRSIVFRKYARKISCPRF